MTIKDIADKKHKHADLTDMIICYEKDKELDIPILELSYMEVLK